MCILCLTATCGGFLGSDSFGTHSCLFFSTAVLSRPFLWHALFLLHLQFNTVLLFTDSTEEIRRLMLGLMQTISVCSCKYWNQNWHVKMRLHSGINRNCHFSAMNPPPALLFVYEHLYLLEVRCNSQINWWWYISESCPLLSTVTPPAQISCILKIFIKWYMVRQSCPSNYFRIAWDGGRLQRKWSVCGLTGDTSKERSSLFLATFLTLLHSSNHFRISHTHTHTDGERQRGVCERPVENVEKRTSKTD